MIYTMVEWEEEDFSYNTNNDIVSTLSRPIRPIVELNSNISIDVNNAYSDGKTPQTGWELK